MLSTSPVYPAQVTFPDGTVVDKAKLFVQGGVAVVGTVRDRRIVEAARLEGVTATQKIGAVTYLTADDGTTWEVRRGAGCGCGSPLKRWNPFTAPATVGT